MADNNTFFDATASETFTGGIQGGGILTEELTFHNSTGLITATGRIVFTGTVMNSQPGSMVIVLAAVATAANLAQLTSLHAQLVLTDGTGGLTGLHGEGTIGIVDGHLVYSVLVHFDPA